MFRSLLAAAVAVVFAGSVCAQDEKQKGAGGLELKVAAKEKSYTLDTGGKTKEDYKKDLEKIAEEQKKKKGDFGGNLPKSPSVDLVVSVVNTGKEDVTVYVGGDSNLLLFTLKGPGALTLEGQRAFTADFRGSKGIKLEAGKSYDIPVKVLMDGFRGAGRNLYWTDAGEYTLSATYQLASNTDGGRGPLLKSDAVKLTVTEKK